MSLWIFLGRIAGVALANDRYDCNRRWVLNWSVIMTSAWHPNGGRMISTCLGRVSGENSSECWRPMHTRSPHPPDRYNQHPFTFLFSVTSSFFLPPYPFPTSSPSLRLSFLPRAHPFLHHPGPIHPGSEIQGARAPRPHPSNALRTRAPEDQAVHKPTTAPSWPHQPTSRGP